MKRERSVDGSSDGLGRDILIMKPTWTDMVTEINLNVTNCTGSLVYGTRFKNGTTKISGLTNCSSKIALCRPIKQRQSNKTERALLGPRRTFRSPKKIRHADTPLAMTPKGNIIFLCISP